MSTKIEGGSDSGGLANVDANFSLRATGPGSPDEAGFALVAAERNPAGVGIGRVVDRLRAARQRRLRVGMDTQVFCEPFLGSTGLNTTQWATTLDTLTNSLVPPTLTLNVGGGTWFAVPGSSRVQSYPCFPVQGPFETYFSWEYIYSQTAPVVDCTFEMGAFFATGSTAPTDGVFVRYTNLGAVECVVNFNGTETTSTITAPAGLVRHRVVIGVQTDAVDFWIDDELVASIATPSGRGSPVGSAALPITFRYYNGPNSPATWVSPRIFAPAVSYGSMQNNRDTQTTAALAGGMAAQGQTGNNLTQTNGYANSAAPTTATLLNTFHSYPTLGGQFRFAAVAGAETDYLLFGFNSTSPLVGTVNKKLIITAARITTWVEVVAVATTPTVLQWSLGVGGNTSSLATAESVTAKAARRVPLGAQTFLVGAAVGSMPSQGDVVVTFGSPLVYYPGEWVQVIMKVPTGTATATQTFRGIIAFDGYWE